MSNLVSAHVNGGQKLHLLVRKNYGVADVFTSLCTKKEYYSWEIQLSNETAILNMCGNCLSYAINEGFLHLK